MTDEQTAQGIWDEIGPCRLDYDDTFKLRVLTRCLIQNRLRSRGEVFLCRRARDVRVYLELGVVEIVDL